MIADSAMKLEAARQLTCAAAAKSERAMPGENTADLTFFSSACNRRPSVIVTGRTNTPGDAPSPPPRTHPEAAWHTQLKINYTNKVPGCGTSQSPRLWRVNAQRPQRASTRTDDVQARMARRRLG